MELDIAANPDVLPWQSLYKIMVGSVVPRPIGWISSIDEHGQHNLAPFSFFNVVCPNPPHILFCPNIRNTDNGMKDTLRNVRATGEFVANIVTEALAEAMNLTATELPPEMDEFQVSGLTPIASHAVKPPRVAESPIHFECRVAQIVDISDGPGGGSVVIGRVVHVHVSEDVLIGGDKIDIAKLRPIGRLAGPSYSRVNDVFDLIRPAPQLKK